ncbi:Anaerobic sulfite reductase subunit B [Phycisphaerae bacterium RAS1]|nr:Anaerobic sulfite reductase subunit B [Phycisphaerae bacterium RAS1]
MPFAEIQSERAASVYLPEPADVLAVKPLTALETQYDLQLQSGEPLCHAPGQFVQVSIFGVGECPISICSSPTRPRTFQLTVRRVGEVTSAIHTLKAGDQVGIRGPLGRGFDVEALHGHDMLIVAGGCALAPARSLIHYILDRRGSFGEFHLLYGARAPAELLFRDELDQWQADREVNCLVTVDRGDPTWTGNTGVVTRLFYKLPPLDPARTKVAVIGPPVMFKFVMLELVARRIPQRNIFCSLERRMKCGVGKCGHCQVNHLYACLDGPVFSYDEIAAVREAIE